MAIAVLAKMPGVELIRVPGDGSHPKQQDRLVNGIPINDSLCAILNQIAANSRIEPVG